MREGWAFEIALLRQAQHRLAALLAMTIWERKKPEQISLLRLGSLILSESNFQK